MMRLLVGAALIVIAVLGYKLLRHERHQDREILRLSNELNLLRKKTAKNDEAESFRHDCIKNAANGGCNYLAIGNSITLHGTCSYWYTVCGMAASEASKDYFHLVTEELRKHNGHVNAHAYNFSVWEMMAHDRAEAITLVDPYLNENIHIITLQFDKNIIDLTTFESDYEYLINHIKHECPNAQIITVSDFWENGERDNMKFRVSEKCNVRTADIRAIKDNRDYMCGIGTEVLGDDGEKHIVNHEGVASHPGDKGMKYIADRIIECIDFSELNRNMKGEN